MLSSTPSGLLLSPSQLKRTNSTHVIQCHPLLHGEVRKCQRRVALRFEFVLSRIQNHPVWIRRISRPSESFSETIWKVYRNVSAGAYKDSCPVIDTILSV